MRKNWRSIFRHKLPAVLLIIGFLAGGALAPMKDQKLVDRAGLKNAIVSMMRFVQTTDDPSAFSMRLKETLAAFRTVAHLNAVIENPKPEKNFLQSGAVFLVSYHPFQTPDLNFSEVFEDDFDFISYKSMPKHPPPKIMRLIV